VSTIFGVSSSASGLEDSSLIVVQLAATTDPGTKITGFRVTTLPTNGRLFLDSAKTQPVLIDDLLASATNSLQLYFEPAPDFNGNVDLGYVAVGVQSGGSGAAHATEFYLTVAGIDGGVTVRDFEGTFAIEDFAFDILAASNWTSGGGASVGKPQPQPLRLELKAGSHLNEFVDNIVDGQQFPLLRLEGVVSDGGITRQTVYDLRLEGVLVTKVTDTDGTDYLEVVYRKVSLTTAEYDPKGGLGAAQTIAWDVPGGTISDVPLGIAQAGSNGGAFNPTSYYLTVDGLDGGVTQEGYEGAFGVEDFVFNILADSSWTRGGGASVGKAQPEPLKLELKAGSHLNEFVDNIVGGQQFPLLRLEGVVSDGGVLRTVYDLRLEGVFVTKVSDTDGNDYLEVVYRKVSLTTTEQDGRGGLGVTQTIAWDVPAATTSQTPLAIAQAGAHVIESDPATVSIIVAEVNDAPVANPDSYNTVLGQTLTVPADGVLANDTDVDNSTADLVAQLQSTTTDGIFSFNAADGSFSFKSFFKGETGFTYVANDGELDSNVAAVSIMTAVDATTLDLSDSTVNTAVTLSNTAGASFMLATGTPKQTLANSINNVISGSGNDSIRGNNSGGILNGGGGNDSVTGGTGVDYIIGGSGTDRLTGGANDDVFIFRPGFGTDTVTDFNVGTVASHDTLDLRGLGISSVADLLSNTSSAGYYVDGGASAVIHVGADSITLANVSKALLLSHQYDILV